jgi:hypothetical protein
MVVGLVLWREGVERGRRLEVRRGELMDIVSSWNQTMFRGMGLSLGISGKGSWLWVENSWGGRLDSEDCGVELGEMRGEERAPTEYACDGDRDAGWNADHKEYVYGNCSACIDPQRQELDDHDF